MKFKQVPGATSIITFFGKKFLIDPFFAPKGATPPVPSRYNHSNNPLVELPIPVDEIIDVDAVVVSHMHHFDHFDKWAQKAIPKNTPMFTQSLEEAEDMRGLGFTNVTALKDEGVEFEGVFLHRVEALHGHGIRSDIYYDELGLPSEVSGVMLTAPAEKTLYIAGDTIWYEGVKKNIERYHPEIIAINAANAQFYDGTPLLMGLDGLYEVAKAAPQATIVATHMDTVNHARVTRADLKTFVSEKEIAHRVYIPEDGEELTL